MVVVVTGQLIIGEKPFYFTSTLLITVQVNQNSGKCTRGTWILLSYIVVGLRPDSSTDESESVVTYTSRIGSALPLLPHNYPSNKVQINEEGHNSLVLILISVPFLETAISIYQVNLITAAY